MSLKKSQRTSVYIIAKTDGIDFGKFTKRNIECLFKIGFSSDPEKRKQQMNFMPMETLLISEYEFPSRNESQRAEQLIHSILYYYNFKHEWFYLTQDRLIKVDKILVTLLWGSCHYHEKQWFVKPKITPEEMLASTKLDLFNPVYEKREALRARLAKKPLRITSNS